MGKTKEGRRCAECRAGEHDDYDNDVQLAVVRDPETKRIVMRAYLCGDHRAARRDDGYEVMEGAWPGHDATVRNENRRDAMKKAGTKNAGKQEKTVKESKAKNGKAKLAVRELPSERLGVPPTTPDVDLKVKAAEAAHGAPTVATKAAKPTKDATAKTGGDTGERGATGAKPMSLMDAAVNILSQGTGDPMRCKDIVDLAAQRGLWTPRTGKTPASTLYAAILREIVSKGDASRFVKTERGKFALRDSQYAREATAKGPKA